MNLPQAARPAARWKYHCLMVTLLAINSRHSMHISHILLTFLLAFPPILDPQILVSLPLVKRAAPYLQICMMNKLYRKLGNFIHETETCMKEVNSQHTHYYIVQLNNITWNKQPRCNLSSWSWSIHILTLLTTMSLIESRKTLSWKVLRKAALFNWSRCCSCKFNLKKYDKGSQTDHKLDLLPILLPHLLKITLKYLRCNIPWNKVYNLNFLYSTLF